MKFSFPAITTPRFWLISLALVCIGFSKPSLSDSCATVIETQQSDAAARNASHQEKYAACISCCGGISPEIPTRLCGAFPVPYHVKSDGLEVWTEYQRCHPFVIENGACTSGKINVTACTQTTEKQPNDMCEPQAGDPIIIATGNSFQTEKDYESNSHYGLSFSRFYNSTAYNIPTIFGRKWTHSYSSYLVITDTTILANRAQGQMFRFTLQNDEWISDDDVSARLTKQLDENNALTGWVYHHPDNTKETYSTDGRLNEIIFQNGSNILLEYDLAENNGEDADPNTLDKITDPHGNSIQFTYDNYFTYPKRIKSLTDPAGQVYRYAYDAIGNLISVSYPDSTPQNNSDNPTRLYHYENADFPHHLTGITDENGQRYVSWSFDSAGRATSSILADGIETTLLTFNADESVTVTNPLGKETTYHFTTLHGVKKVTQIEGHPTESCAGANQHYTYDAIGNLASKTNWQGHLTTYIHDSQGLEISRTEAVGTPAERTITTTWHADYRLPLTITQPGKVTSFSYDPQGRLISKTTHEVQQ